MSSNPYSLPNSFYEPTTDTIMNTSTFIITEKNAQIVNRWADVMDQFFSTYTISRDFTIKGSIICDNIIAAQLRTIDKNTGEVTTQITANDERSNISLSKLDNATHMNIPLRLMKRDHLGRCYVSDIYTSSTSIETNRNQISTKLDSNAQEFGGNAATASAAKSGSVLYTDIQSKLNINATQFGGNAATASSANFANTAQNATNAGYATFAQNSGSSSTCSGNAATASAAKSNSQLEVQIDGKLNADANEFDGNAASATKLNIREGRFQKVDNVLKISFNGGFTYGVVDNGTCYHDVTPGNEKGLCFVYENELYNMPMITT